MQRICRDRAHAPIHPSHKAQHRKSSLFAAIAHAALALLSVGQAQAQVTATFPAAADATLYQDITGGIANTRGDFVHAGPNNGAQARRAVIRFDLSSIPPGSTITAASLRMVVTQMRAGGGTATITAHRLTSSWSEGPPRSPSDVLPPAGEGSGAPPRPGDVTWLHRISPSTFWTSAGGDFIATASATVTAAGLGAQTWTGTSIIADVQNWVNDSNTNNGWLLRGNEALTGSARQMASRSNPNAANRPSLSVTFLPPPGAGACCFASGQCIVTLPTTCTGMGGNFNGVGVLCSPTNPCPQPTGVCCLPSGACQITTPPNCASLSGDYRGDNLTCAQVSCPIPLEPFVDALPIPPVAVPTTGVSGGAAHYDITMREFTAKVHRDLPPTRQWGYNGISPGPTIIARKGQPVTVNWINDLRDSNNVLRTTHLLPVDTCLHGPDVTGAVPVTVVHLHGAKVAPASDGDPDAAFPPGSQAPLYTYPNDQLATTLWYHDHALGLTRLNVHMGLAAFYLIRDSVEDALNIPKGEYEIPLLLMDRSFNGDGSIRYNPAFSDTFFGDTILVNGKAWPFLNVKRTKYRFRIVNASGTRTFTLSLSNGAQFQQIGSDGGLLASPATLSSVTIQPSERADIVIDFATLTPGESVILRNSAPAPFPGTQGVGVVPNVMKFVVQPEFGPGVFLPATLASVPRIPEAQATTNREFRLQQVFEPTCGYNMWTINGLSWDDITEFPRIGTTEIWSFANLSTVTHPLHVHLVQMQILDRQDFVVQEGNIVPVGTRNPPPANEAGWKDTVQVYPQQITRAIMKFDGFSGLFPYHCHILEHEDHEMMRKFEVLCDPPSVQTPPQQLTVNENATAQFSVSATGDVLAYQWRRNNVNLNNGPQTGGSVVSGATTNTLTITTPDPRDSAPYTCVITNPCGLSATTPVNLIVTPACPGDLNFNNAVNTADLTIFLANFGRSVQPGTSGDLNADGAVNTIDLTIFLTNFGRPCP